MGGVPHSNGVMNWAEIIQTVGGVLVGLGGWKVVEALLFRRPKAQLAEAEADAAEEKAKAQAIETNEKEFALIRKQLEFAQEQALTLQKAEAEKEKRFQEQTAVVRDLNRKLLEATATIGDQKARISELETERSQKLCERRGCPSREPQSGF